MPEETKGASDSSQETVSNEASALTSSGAESIIKKALGNLGAKPQESPAAEAEGDAESAEEATPEGGAETEPETELSADEPDQEQEPEDQDQAEPAGEDEAPKGWPEKAIRRVNKLTAQKAELKARLDAVEAELTEIKNRPEPEPPQDNGATPKSGNPLADVKTEAELARRVDESERLLDWVETQLIDLEENPELVETQLKNNSVTLPDYTPEKMKVWLLKTKQAVAKTLRHAPQQAKFLQLSAESSKKAKALFPWWKDRNSKEYQMAQNVLASRPGIREWADWELVAGVFVEGLKVVQGKQAEATNKAKTAGAKPPLKAPRAPDVAGKIAPRPSASDEMVKKARERLLTDPEEYTRQMLRGKL